MTIEIINNTRGGIEGKIGERGVWGPIQVPDVHSFTISETKKVVLDGLFYFLNCYRRKNIENIIPKVLFIEKVLFCLQNQQKDLRQR